MSGYPLTILSPAAIPSDRSRLSRDTRPAVKGARRRTIGLLNNGKPNVEHLFRGVEERLRSAGYDTFLSFEKPTAGRPVAEPIFQKFVSSCGLVITAMCD